MHILSLTSVTNMAIDRVGKNFQHFTYDSALVPGASSCVFRSGRVEPWVLDWHGDIKYIHVETVQLYRQCLRNASVAHYIHNVRAHTTCFMTKS